MAKTAHIFPGQGAFFAGPLRGAITDPPGNDELLAIVEAVAVRRFGRSLIAALWDERNDAAHLMQSDPALLQLGIFTVSVAAHRLLRARGVEADVLMGHSFGEIAALTCAGVFSIAQGADIVCDRVECLAADAPPDGCMAAISASAARVRGLLTGSAVAVAVENHDSQTVVSGPAADIAAFLARCRSEKLSAQKLHSPYGFHHRSLAGVTTAFAKRLARYPAGVPQRKVYSPIMGRTYRPNDAFGDCLAQHLVTTVAFSAAVQNLRADGVSVFIECGALDGLTRIVGRILGPHDVHVFPTFTPGSVADGGCEAILDFIRKDQAMNAPVSPAFPEFESFWRERSPFILALIKSEFAGFLMQQRHSQWMPAEMTASTPLEPVIEPPKQRRRDQLFAELVGVYAEAMEYPPEVFTETVELEAELGIDSVKQTEIMGRLSETYELPRLPANVRISDFKSMGQVVDLVFANQGKGALVS